MYSLEAYGSMLKDKIRMDAYEEAIRSAVTPGSIVLDIGTGTGVHALMAAREGAGHVYAVEPADSVVLAPDVARTNGYGDVITFIQDLSTRITLPERADVIVSDLHGTLPWYGQHIPTIIDARRRHLKGGGTLIPQRDSVYLVAAEAPESYAAYGDPWRKRPYGFDMEQVASCLTNSYTRGRVGRDGFLTQVQLIAEIDYGSIEDPNVSVVLELHPIRTGTMHGIMIWFDTDVFEDIRLTSAPFEPEISYGSSFFPLTQPVPVEPGDTIRLEWQGILQGSEYLWIWNCEVLSSDGRTRASFRQNSLATQLIPLERLRKRAPSFRPRLNPDGEVLRSILNLMGEGQTLEEMSRALQEKHPGTFRSGPDALERVRSVSERYG